jgi:hypothetical protein
MRRGYSASHERPEWDLPNPILQAMHDFYTQLGNAQHLESCAHDMWLQGCLESAKRYAHMAIARLEYAECLAIQGEALL